MNLKNVAMPRVVGTESLASYIRDVMDAILSTPVDGFASRRRATPPGLDIRAFDSGSALGKAIEDALIASSALEGSPRESLTAYICHPGIAGVPSPAKWANQRYSPHHIDRELAGHGLRASFFFDLDHWHLFDIERGLAVQLMARHDAFPPWETGAPLRPFLHWHYAARGMRLSHAGTLGFDGAGILLAGAGGSGKSGTVIAGILNGLQTVGDDYVLIDMADGPVARPVFKVVKQDPRGIERLGLAELPRISPDLNWQGKFEFRIEDLTSVPVPEALRLTALMVPQVSTGGATRIEPIGKPEAMMALAASAIHQMPGERESGFRFFSEVTKQLPCYRLTLGPEPTAVADTIRSFIRQHA